MNNSFVNVLSTRDRHFGGTQKGTADPYISGYQFIYWKVLPKSLPAYMNYMYSSTGSVGPQERGIPGIQNFLANACMSVTVPGGTLNKTEFTGLGGSKWAAPTNMDYGNTLTIKFLEFSGLPVTRTFHSWFRMIREYRTGTSPLVGNNNADNSYSKTNYTGTLLYWTTKPDGVNVEFAALYTGVFPTKDPQDSFNGDITSVDKLEIDMEFSIDWIWQEPWVYTEAQNWARAYKANMNSAHGSLSQSGNNLTQNIGYLEERGSGMA
jgi:hypothetical protein